MSIFAKVPIQRLVDTVANWNPLKAEAEAVFTYIDLSAVDQDTKSIVAANEITCAEAPSRARQLVASGDVLVSTVRPNLNGVALVPDELDGATASTGFCVIRPKPSQLDRRYIYHWVRSPAFVSEMVSLATGASYPAVSDKIVLGSRIPLPPITEQRRIGAILNQADALRAKRREALAQLDRLTQAIFVEMFGDSRKNPKLWSTAGIESVCELIVDCVNRTAPIVDEPTPYKMIRTSNVKAGKVDLSSVRYVTADTFKVWNRRATPIVGDVLLTREAPLGEAGILDTNDSVFLGQRLMLYRPAKKHLVSEYLLHSFLSPFLQDQFERYGSGSTVKHLPLPACRAFELRIPPLPLQQTFATRIQAIEALKANHRAALADLDALFTSLQHRAFRGEL